MDHLLQRLLPDGEEITTEDRSRLIIQNNQIYCHKAVRINYTTYDNRREQDFINPRTHSDVMVLSDEDDVKFHPYWYARVIGVFHAMVRFNSPRARAITSQTQCMEFLWVRWYGIDYDSDTVKSAFQAKRMYQVGFLDSDSAFGFINPSDVLRSVHLIPSFVSGQVSEIGISPLARRPEEDNQDYVRYYINM